MAVNVLGIVSVVVFYLLILAVGIWAGRKKNNKSSTAPESSKEEDVMVAGRL